jgi:hypothetical protein
VDPLRRVLVVETGAQCADAVRGPAYTLVVVEDADAAYQAILQGSIDAVVVHIEETSGFDERVGLVRRLQNEDATRMVPLLVVITQRPDRPSAMTTQRYGSAMIKLTTPDCTGLAEALAELMWERRLP